ncbi:MAG: fumarate reductase flavoprotein subunit [Gammaproteobacteria bacterium]
MRTTDVLVIGAGLAGERCAMEAAAAGHDVIILSLVPPRRSHSCAAQGGMQAALGNCVKAAGDNPDVHFLDTVRGSDWGADQEVARIFADNAPVAVRELAYFGVPWTRVRPGRNTYHIKGKQVEIDEPEEKAGLIMHRDFGGTAKWRACYAAAGTGHAALYAMDSQVVRLGITVLDRMEALALVHDGERCHGAVVRSLRTGRCEVIGARATVIATGGHGRIYGKYTTNATINEGTGASIAMDTGVVPLGNMEAVQFHPTGLWPSGILVTEGCRGDGGYLLNASGDRFLVELEPEKQELASRDVVSRHMMAEIRDGRGVDSPHGPHLWLDLRHLGETHLTTKLREVYEICRDFLGIKPWEELIPVRPTQHYSMGGVRVNKDGEAYGLSGLYAGGEAACWDMHGFNRLGGNSLAETLVAGRVVGMNITRALDAGVAVPDLSLAGRFLSETRGRIDAWLGRSGDGPTVYELRDRLADIMMGKLGVFRTGDELQAAVSELTTLLEVDVPRTESRGAHSRTDFPLRNDRDWLKRTLARWPADSPVPKLSYEPVGLLDLPPGHRGYGSDERVEMTETLEEYNARVMPEQAAEGRQETREDMGTRLKPGAWHGAFGAPAVATGGAS